MTINGTGFPGTGKVGTDFVKFGGLAGTSTTYTVVSDTKITAKVPLSLTAGSYTIAIQNAGQQRGERRELRRHHRRADDHELHAGRRPGQRPGAADA